MRASMKLLTKMIKANNEKPIITITLAIPRSFALSNDPIRGFIRPIRMMNVRVTAI